MKGTGKSYRVIGFVAVIAAAAGVGGCGGCHKKNAPGSAAAGDPTSASGTGSPSAPRPFQAHRPPAISHAIATIDVDEVKDLLPRPDGARPLSDVSKAQVGERIEATYCVDGKSATDTAALVTASLTAAGWQNVQAKPHPTIADRIGLTAQKPPYMLTGTVQRGGWETCAKDKDQTYVAMGVHKLIDRGDGVSSDGTPGGPGGVSGPGSSMGLHPGVPEVLPPSVVPGGPGTGGGPPPPAPMP